MDPKVIRSFDAALVTEIDSVTTLILRGIAWELWKIHCSFCEHFNCNCSSRDNMANNYELSHSSKAIRLPEQEFSSQRGPIDRDEADLVRLGKKPVLKVSAGPSPSHCPSG